MSLLPSARYSRLQYGIPVQKLGQVCHVEKINNHSIQSIRIFINNSYFVCTLYVYTVQLYILYCIVYIPPMHTVLIGVNALLLLPSTLLKIQRML